MDTCVRLAATDSIGAVAPAPISTNSPSRHRPWYQPAWKPTAPVRTRRGMNTPSAPSTGSSAGMTSGWSFTLPIQAAVVTRCTWTESTAIRAPNRRWHFCSRWPKCSSCKTLSPPSTSRLPKIHFLMKELNLRRTHITLHPDRARVLARPFYPTNDDRAIRICSQVMALGESEVHALLKQVQAEFGERHLKIREFLRRRFEQVKQFLRGGQKLSEERQLLIGAYFTHEYSFEAAALFNPSVVPHPDQSDLPPGSLRFILSLRATGEGHISSVTFRTGFLDAHNNITINEPTRYNLEPAQAPNASYEKGLFDRKLKELGLAGGFSRQVLDGLRESF